MNCFLLRLPGESFVLNGYNESLSEGLGYGFVFSLYGESDTIHCIPMKRSLLPPTRNIPYPDSPLYNPLRRSAPDYLQFDKWIEENDTLYLDDYGPLDPSTTEKDHIEYIEKCINEVKRLEKSAGKRSKIIASRILNQPTELSATEIFRILEKKYPECTVFLFSTPEYGTWIGASPEEIINGYEKNVCCTSLAGTRTAHLSQSEEEKFSQISGYDYHNGPDKVITKSFTDGWDTKNIEEQQIVTEFVRDTYRKFKLSPVTTGPLTHRYGPVEHLESVTSASLPKNCNTTKMRRRLFERMLAALAPTPAISGYPREEAMDFIDANEGHLRDCYGGFIGFYDFDDAIYTYATLRCGHYSKAEKRILLYAGGGITRDSDPASEWQETEIKLSTLRSIL